MGSVSMSACLGSKAYARPASERGEKATHETKQTRSRGDALRIWGSPPKSPTAGPTANCGPAGPRSKAQSRGRFARIESERLLLMQRRCRSPNMNGVRARQEPLGSITAQVTSLHGLRREAGSWLEPSSLLGFLPRQPSVTGPIFVRGGRKLEVGDGTAAIGTLDALILFGNKLKSSIIPPL